MLKHSVSNADEKIIKKYELFHRQCEDQEKILLKLKGELEHYIQKEEARRESSWRVDFGEEAKVDTDSTISAMLQLSNGHIVIAALSEDN